MPENTFPEIITEKLILNQLKKVDIEDIVSCLNDKVFSQNTLNIPFPYTKDDAEFWIKLAEEGFENNKQFIFAIRTKENNKIIGGIGLSIESKFNRAELGYWISKEYWNKGIASEATQAILKFGFDKLKLKRIFATHFEFNKASGEVMKKSGMKKEGFLNCYTHKNGEYQNHFLYAIINEKI